tara:strand:+ start:50 stop:244 length:195 start_codon:yes stop_codon:yes gene_type:complete
MSSQPKIDEKIAYNDTIGDHSKRVNLNDLVNRLNKEKKEERKNNLLMSAAAVSAVAVFGIILTL